MERTRVVSVRVPEDVAEKLEQLGADKARILRGLVEIAAAFGERKACEEAAAKLLKWVIENGVRYGYGRAEDGGVTAEARFTTEWDSNTADHVPVAELEIYTNEPPRHGRIRLYGDTVTSEAPCTIIDHFDVAAKAIARAVRG